MDTKQIHDIVSDVTKGEMVVRRPSEDYAAIHHRIMHIAITDPETVARALDEWIAAHFDELLADAKLYQLDMDNGLGVVGNAD